MAVSKTTIAAVRFGYGFHPGQTPPRDAEDLLAQLTAPARPPALAGHDRAERAALFREMRAAARAKRKGEDVAEMFRARKRALRRQLLRDAAARLAAPVLSERGFRQRLVWFWADHFTISARNRRVALLVAPFEAEAIRPNIAGAFSDLLRAAATHPAMLAYLDQARSFGPHSPAGRRRGRGLNENLAREIMELHTLGVGAGYTQRDVREFAELLTGLTIDPDDFDTVFRRQMAEPGAETVLGRSYGGRRARLSDIHEALDDLARRPETARHIARKLAVHFVADRPEPGLVDHLAAAFTDSGGWLPAVYEALLEHPESWRPEQRKVKQPFDYVVSSLRAAGPDRRDLRRALKRESEAAPLKALDEMNQRLFTAPGPDGWPEEAEAWITPQGLAARLNWAARFGRWIERRADPRDFVETALADLASPETRFAATRAAERWEGIALTLASPEFNRR